MNLVSVQGIEFGPFVVGEMFATHSRIGKKVERGLSQLSENSRRWKRSGNSLWERSWHAIYRVYSDCCGGNRGHVSPAKPGN
jgi:hypothetical protein